MGGGPDGVLHGGLQWQRRGNAVPSRAWERALSRVGDQEREAAGVGVGISTPFILQHVTSEFPFACFHSISSQMTIR